MDNIHIEHIKLIKWPEFETICITTDLPLRIKDREPDEKVILFIDVDAGEGENYCREFFNIEPEISRIGEA